MKDFTSFFLFTFLLFGSSCLLAQKMPVEDNKLGGILPINQQGEVVYESVLTISGATKKELFTRGRAWFADYYRSAKSVLETSDSDLGELSGNANFTINPTMMGIVGVPTLITYRITIEVKDGRYRARLRNFYMDSNHKVTGPLENIHGTTKGFLTKVFTGTDEHVKTLLASLDKAMNTPKDDF